MKKICIIQARMSSSRLPGKVLLDLGGISVLGLLIHRLKKSKLIDHIVLATSEDVSDNVIADFCIDQNIQLYRGSLNDVLDRYYQASKLFNLSGDDRIIRITADCPLIDPQILDKVVQFSIDSDLDYCSNTLRPTYPDGMDVSVAKFSALQRAWQEAILPSEREHVFPYIVKNSTFNNQSFFTSSCYMNAIDQSMFRITIDTEEDYEVVKSIVSNLGHDVLIDEILNFLISNKEISQLNDKYKRNEGYLKSLEQDKKA